MLGLHDYQSLILFVVLTIVSFVVLNYIRDFLFKRLTKIQKSKDHKKHKYYHKTNAFKNNALLHINKVSKIAVLIISVLIAIAVSGTENKFLANFASKSLLVFLLVGITYVAAILSEVVVKRHYARFSDISLITGFIKIVIYIMGAMVVVQSIGIKITPLITALGIGGIAFAFAIQPTLANFFSGLNILASGQVAKGDYVVISDKVEGFVKDVAWRNTAIQSLSNVLHIVPNQVLSDAIVSNFSKPDKVFFVTVPVGIAYSSDLETVEKVTLDVAKYVLKHETINIDIVKHQPIFRFAKFGESSVDFIAILPVVDVGKRSYTIHFFIKELHKAFAENGIQIPFTIRVIKKEDEL